ncbi:MAG: transcriptional repressor [Candidatus Coatesbacteria bacterium]|nr:MAG: transcriptional repressor [Candidatus Coatesbacteria bacterium]
MADGKLRMTEQRRVILEELRKVKTHPTADEVYELVRRRLPRISMGTVYRNLDILSESGEILKLDSGPQMRFDGDTKDHYHVRCVRCGRVGDLHVEPIPGLDKFVGSGREFDIIGYRLEFIGICPSCREDRKKGEKKRI